MTKKNKMKVKDKKTKMERKKERKKKKERKVYKDVKISCEMMRKMREWKKNCLLKGKKLETKIKGRR